MNLFFLKNKKVSLSPLLFLGMFFLSVLSFANAQSFIPESSTPSQAINLSISPEIPAPGESVSVSVGSFLVDLNNADIGWYLNGAFVSGGRSQKSFNFTAGASGTLVTLSVVVSTSAGESIYRQISFRPSSLDLVWQAENSYTLPFYKGKTLPAYEGAIKIIAMPGLVGADGAPLSPQNLVYTWEKDNTVLGSLSGLGKRTLSLKLPKLSNSVRVEVEVASLDKKTKASKSVVISSFNTKALVYENNPLLGVLFNKVLRGSANVVDKEMTLIAYPQFFSGTGLSDTRLLYNWGINNKNSGKGADITLRSPEENSGVASISVSIENDREILQSTSQSFNVNFGASSASNPFF